MKSYFLHWWIPFGLLLYFGSQCFGLQNVRLIIPTAIQRRHSAVFQCQYDLEGDTLYSVKWYKGLREFYRYTPTDSPPYKIFPLLGLNVDSIHSNSTHLYLVQVDSSVGGKYSCEVSADAPSFHTALVTGETNVVEIPSHTPTISGIKPKYRLGDTLRGNCTSKDSKPAANLTWYINSELAEFKYVKPLRKYRTGRNDLETSQIGLRFTVGRHHFENGRLKIRCVASVYSIYWKSTEKSVDEERPKLSLSNAVTPNTLGVNQLPSPYDFYQPNENYFDEDFPSERRHHHSINSVQHTKPEQQQPTEEATGSSSSSLVRRRCNWFLLACAVLQIQAHFV